MIRFAESKPFQMGSVTSRRIVHPDLGAKKLTLNLSVSQAGAEFAQHTHDGSDDTILVLDGEVDLRQGDSRRKFRTGEAAFIPAGQIHGTITTGGGDNIMISFQTPPDLKLYSGARDPSRAGAAPPAGVITPGAVKFVNFAKSSGQFSGPKLGSNKGTASHWKLGNGQRLKSEVPAGGEEVWFVWRGAVELTSNGQVLRAGERDTVFATGGVALDGRAAADGTVVIQIQAPGR